MAFRGADPTQSVDQTEARSDTSQLFLRASPCETVGVGTSL